MSAAFEILCDTREQRPPPLPAGFVYEMFKLGEGDYTTRELIDVARIERKSAGDLVGTLTHGRERFEREADRLRAFPYRCIIVEGSAADVSRRGRIHPHALIGSLASLHARWGIPSIFLESPEAVGRYIAGVLRRLEEERAAETCLSPAEIERVNLLACECGSRAVLEAQLDLERGQLSAAERFALPSTIATIRRALRRAEEPAR